MEEYVDRIMSAMGSRFGLIRERASSVRATEDTTVVLIPGTSGVAIVILGQLPDGRTDHWASAAPLQAVLQGRPICDSGVDRSRAPLQRTLLAALRRMRWSTLEHPRNG